MYGKPEHVKAWDCIVTCFFIDCASNIVACLERIYSCLKDNGIWINIGPLLYHYADLPDEDSIEPSYDFLVPIIKKIGFKFEVSHIFTLKIKIKLYFDILIVKTETIF